MSFQAAMAYMHTRVSRLLARASFHCVRGTHEKKEKAEFNRALAFAHRRGCGEVLQMHQRTDLGAVQDMLRLSRVPQLEERGEDAEPCSPPVSMHVSLGPPPAQWKEARASRRDTRVRM